MDGNAEYTLPLQGPQTAMQFLGVESFSHSGTTIQAQLAWLADAGMLATGQAGQVVVYTGTATAGGTVNFLHESSGMTSIASGGANTMVLQSTGAVDTQIQFNTNGANARYTAGVKHGNHGAFGVPTFNIKTGAPAFTDTDTFVLATNGIELHGAADFAASINGDTLSGSATLAMNAYEAGKSAEVLVTSDRNVGNTPGTAQILYGFETSAGGGNYYFGMDISVSDTDLYWNTTKTDLATNFQLKLTAAGQMTIKGTANALLEVMASGATGSASITATASTDGPAHLQLEAAGTATGVKPSDAYVEFVTGASNTPYSLGIDRNFFTSMPAADQGCLVVSRGITLANDADRCFAITPNGNVYFENETRWCQSSTNVVADTPYYGYEPQVTQRGTTITVSTVLGGTPTYTAPVWNTGTTMNVTPTVAAGDPGTGAQFTIVVSVVNTIASATCDTKGNQYTIGNTLTFAGSSLTGGTSGSAIYTLVAADLENYSVKLKLPEQGPRANGQILTVKNLSVGSSTTDSAELQWIDSTSGTIAAGVANEMAVYLGGTAIGPRTQFTSSTTAVAFTSAGDATFAINGLGAGGHSILNANAFGADKDARILVTTDNAIAPAAGTSQVYYGWETATVPTAICTGDWYCGIDASANGFLHWDTQPTDLACPPAGFGPKMTLECIDDGAGNSRGNLLVWSLNNFIPGPGIAGGAKLNASLQGQIPIYISDTLNTGADALLVGWGAGITGIAGTDTQVVAPTTSGSGTGAMISVTITANVVATVTTVTVAGSGYRMGDTITVSGGAPFSGGGTSTLTLTAAHFGTAATQAEGTTALTTDFGSDLQFTGTSAAEFTLNSTTAGDASVVMKAVGVGASTANAFTNYWVDNGTGTSTNAWMVGADADGGGEINPVSGLWPGSTGWVSTTTGVSTGSYVAVVTSTDGMGVGLKVRIDMITNTPDGAEVHAGNSGTGYKAGDTITIQGAGTMGAGLGGSGGTLTRVLVEADLRPSSASPTDTTGSAYTIAGPVSPVLDGNYTAGGRLTLFSTGRLLLGHSSLTALTPKTPLIDINDTYMTVNSIGTASFNLRGLPAGGSAEINVEASGATRNAVIKLETGTGGSALGQAYTNYSNSSGGTNNYFVGMDAITGSTVATTLYWNTTLPLFTSSKMSLDSSGNLTTLGTINTFTLANGSELAIAATPSATQVMVFTGTSTAKGSANLNVAANGSTFTMESDQGQNMTATFEATSAPGLGATKDAKLIVTATDAGATTNEGGNAAIEVKAFDTDMTASLKLQTDQDSSDVSCPLGQAWVEYREANTNGVWYNGIDTSQGDFTDLYWARDVSTSIGTAPLMLLTTDTTPGLFLGDQAEASGPAMTLAAASVTNATNNVAIGTVGGTCTVNGIIPTSGPAITTPGTQYSLMMYNTTTTAGGIEQTSATAQHSFTGVQYDLMSSSNTATINYSSESGDANRGGKASMILKSIERAGTATSSGTIGTGSSLENTRNRKREPGSSSSFYNDSYRRHTIYNPYIRPVSRRKH